MFAGPVRKKSHGKSKLSALVSIIGVVILSGSIMANAQEAQRVDELRNTLSAPQEVILSQAAEQIALTIYRDNLVMVSEKRRVNLPAGRSTVSFTGVSDLIIPQTAILRDFSAIRLERNFNYDLLSQKRLLEKSIGKEVILARTSPVTGRTEEVRATVLSAGNGVILDVNGRIETFDCSGLPEKITFDDIPTGLRAKPTLSVEISTNEAGPQEMTLSYLASGFDWSADYILSLDPSESKAQLSGWLTLENSSTLQATRAPTAIIAGDLQRLWETRAEPQYAEGFSATCWPRGSTKTGIAFSDDRVEAFADRAVPAPMMMRGAMAFEKADEVVVTGSRLRRAEREDLADYKLYRTPEPTDINAYQTKQVLFLNKSNIDVTRVHVFALDPDDIDVKNWDTDIISFAQLRYDIDNSKEGNLGEPLPEGTVRVMLPGPEGTPFFLGEGYVRDLAVDLPVEVSVAESSSVTQISRLVSENRRKNRDGSERVRKVVEQRIANANPYSVIVELTQDRDGYYAPVSVSQSSIRWNNKDGYPKAKLTIPANSAQTIQYAIQYNE